MLIWPDYVIIAIVVLSIIIGYWRGFVKEVFSLAIWGLAAWAAFAFSDPVADLLANGVNAPSVRIFLAFAAIFLGVLLVGGLVTFLIGKAVQKTGLSGTDRLLGGVFGWLRGIAITIILLVLAGFGPFPRDDWWQQSRFIPKFLPAAQWVVGLLPDQLAKYVSFDATEPASDETETEAEDTDSPSSEEQPQA